MIYTVTFNPALDYAIYVDHYRAGEVNRMSEEKILPGGKGINVSVVLKNLGVDSVALGFIAGFTGEEIRRRLTEDCGQQGRAGDYDPSSPPSIEKRYGIPTLDRLRATTRVARFTGESMRK